MKIKFICEQGYVKRIVAIKIAGKWYIMWRKNDNNILRIVELPTDIGDIKCCYYDGDITVTTKNGSTWSIPLSYAENDYYGILTQLHSFKNDRMVLIKKVVFSKKTNVSAIFDIIWAMYKRYIKSPMWDETENFIDNNEITIKVINKRIEIKIGDICYYCLEGANQEIIVSPVPIYTDNCILNQFFLTNDNKCIYKYENHNEIVSDYESDNEIIYNDFLKFVNELYIRN